MSDGPNSSRSSNSSETSKTDELREAILANLKHAYFNAKTDTVALQNGVIPNQNHALGILNNKADDLMVLISQYGDRREREGRLNEVANFGNWNADKGIVELHEVIDNRYGQLTADGNAKTHIDRGPGFTHHDQDSCGV